MRRAWTLQMPSWTHAVSIIPLIMWHPNIWSALSILRTFIFPFSFFLRANGRCCNPTPVFPSHITGTRIIYDRKFLLDCRNSPLARTPPCCLPQIPGVTVPATHPTGKLQDLKEEAEEEEKETAGKPQLRTPLSAPPPVSFKSATRQILQETCDSRYVHVFPLHYVNNVCSQRSATITSW